MVRNPPPSASGRGVMPETIDLTNDDDFVSYGNHAGLSSTYQTLKDEDDNHIPPIIIDDEEEEETFIAEDDDDFMRIMTAAELQDLVDSTASNRAPSAAPEVSAALTDGTKIEPGMSVELWDKDFLTIKRLVRGQDGDVWMEGILLRRSKAVEDRLHKKTNELCVIIKAEKDTKVPDVDEFLVMRPIWSAFRTRAIIFTNRLYPELSVRDPNSSHCKQYFSWEEIDHEAVLVCRWKYVEFCDSFKHGVASQCMQRLREHECDAGLGTSDVQLMLIWHKGTTKKIQTEIDLTAADDDSEYEIVESFTKTIRRQDRHGIYEKKKTNTLTEHFKPKKVQKSAHRSKTESASQTSRSKVKEEFAYLFGDICSGGGGSARAGSRAGLQVSFVLDHMPDMCKSLRLNWPGAKVLEMDVFDFCNLDLGQRPWLIVDVLHISFPCKPYSAAHTVPGKDDEINEAVGYSVIPILTKTRPRVVTFEQGPRLVSTHIATLNALIHQLTVMNYSVRWKVVNFAETGNVHARRRLFMIASCPGEPLSAFPEPTHGTNPFLKPLTTIKSILRQVRVRMDPHMAAYTEKNMPPFDDNIPLSQCITTNGGMANLHPTGTRTYNCQELAQLGGFPWYHKFFGNKTSVREQIGNAVPAKAATPYFRSIVASMKKFDEEVAAWQRRAEEVIVLD